jgi:hypothetical protein
VSPPPFGQQFDVAPAPPQTSPAGTHEPVFAQRRIGRPSLVVPVASQPPEQHCASDVQGSSWTRHPPSGWHVGVPVPAASRQAVEQHEPLNPSVPHGSPATPHEPLLAHVPTVAPPGRSHMPMQHCPSAVQRSPVARHAPAFAHRQSAPPAHTAPSGAAQRSLQQPPPSVHASPMGLHVVTGLSPHVPPAQWNEQQSPSPVHVVPSTAQVGPAAHVPSAYPRPAQQSEPSTHPAPVPPHAVVHTSAPPPEPRQRSPRQQSPSVAQDTPVAVQDAPSGLPESPPSRRAASSPPPSDPPSVVPTGGVLEHSHPVTRTASRIRVSMADVRIGEPPSAILTDPAEGRS